MVFDALIEIADLVGKLSGNRHLAFGLSLALEFYEFRSLFLQNARALLRNPYTGLDRLGYVAKLLLNISRVACDIKRFQPTICRSLNCSCLVAKRLGLHLDDLLGDVAVVVTEFVGNCLEGRVALGFLNRRLIGLQGLALLVLER